MKRNEIPSMTFFINGNEHNLTDLSAPTVTEALTKYLSEQQSQMSFAVALNGQFVSKQTYAQTQLKHNDALDVLFPIVGG